MGEPDGALSMFVEKQFLSIEEMVCYYIYTTPTQICVAVTVTYSQL